MKVTDARFISQEFPFPDVPTYEYKCTNDGSTFDIWQEVGSPAPPCPDCGAPSKKVFAPPRVIFKGSGFYITDMRAESSGGNSAKTKASGDQNSSDTASNDTASGGAASSDAKPAEKTEAKTEAPKAAPKTE